MRRLFVEPARLPQVGARVTLTKTERHYLFSVLRLRPGDALLLLDGQGRLASATVTAGPEPELRIDAIDSAQRSGAPSIDRDAGAAAGPAITLLQGLAKGDKLDLVVEKATELGVDHILPVACERSVVRLDPEQAARRRARWQRIAQAAAQQCGRLDVPRIGQPTDLRAALRDVPADLKLVPWEHMRGVPLRDALSPSVQLPPQIAVLVGPEGGLTEDEVQAALLAGYTPCGLGPRILRTETAGLMVLSVLSYLAHHI